MEVLLDKLLYGAPTLTLVFAWLFWDQRLQNRRLMRDFLSRFDRQVQILEVLKERLK